MARTSRSWVRGESSRQREQASVLLRTCVDLSRMSDCDTLQYAVAGAAGAVAAVATIATVGAVATSSDATVEEA